jgi:hypothetical protein
VDRTLTYLEGDPMVATSGIVHACALVKEPVHMCSARDSLLTLTSVSNDGNTAHFQSLELVSKTAKTMDRARPKCTTRITNDAALASRHLNVSTISDPMFVA